MNTLAVRISPNPEDLDMRWVIATLRESYWGAWLTPVQIMRAVDNSLCWGAFVEREQIGFLRIVTDRAIFSSVTDLIVAAPHRGQGVGRALVEAGLAHRWVAPTICILKSRDAQPFYAKFGFRMAGSVMQRDPHA